MLERLFLAHPRNVGETYLQHGRVAARFGGTMIAGGMAGLIHAVVPGLFTHAASIRVARLNSLMRARDRGPDERPAASCIFDHQI